MLALLATGAGLLCAGGSDTAGRRTDVLRRSGRLRSRPPTSVRPLPAAIWPVALGGLAVLVAVTTGVAVGAAFAIAGAVVLMLLRDARRNRDVARRGSALLAGVRLMVAELDAGSRPDAALRSAAELCPDHGDALRSAALAYARGESATSLRIDELAPLRCAFDVAASTGAPLADLLARAADDLEAIEARRQRVTSLTAAPRSSAALLALLPVLGMVLGSSLGARPLHVLLIGGSGQALLLAGVVLDVLGVLWTRRIVVNAGRRR